MQNAVVSPIVNIAQQSVIHLELAWALFYATYGMQVFPIYFVNNNGSCSCGDPECKSIDKLPMTQHGFKDATTDLSTIRHLWQDARDANIGVRTGAVSGIVVVGEELLSFGHSLMRRRKRCPPLSGPLRVGPGSQPRADAQSIVTPSLQGHLAPAEFWHQTGSGRAVKRLVSSADEICCANVRTGGSFAVADSHEIWSNM